MYAYPFEHYAFWSRELRRNDLGYGQFGENLTVEGCSKNRCTSATFIASAQRCCR